MAKSTITVEVGEYPYACDGCETPLTPDSRVIMVYTQGALDYAYCPDCARVLRDALGIALEVDNG